MMMVCGMLVELREPMAHEGRGLIECLSQGFLFFVALNVTLSSTSGLKI